MILKSTSKIKSINYGIIIGGYISFIHFFYENIFLAIISAAVVAGEIYQLDLLERYFTKSERKKINQIIPHFGFIIVFMAFFQVIGGLLLTNFLSNFDFALYGLLILGSNILICIGFSAKFTANKISRAKTNIFLDAFQIVLWLTILFGIGGHYMLSSVALVIAFNRSFVNQWKKIRQKKMRKLVTDFGSKKEEIEKVLILEWLKIGKSRKDKILIGVLSHTIIILILNIYFIDINYVLYQLLNQDISFDFIFLLVIILVLFLTYQAIKKSWTKWSKILIPYSLICGLLLFYVINPKALPLYDGIMSLAPSYDYLKTLGLNLNYAPIYQHGAYIISTVISLAYLLFLLTILIEKKSQTINSYEKFSDCEFDATFEFFLKICIASIVIGCTMNILWSGIVLITYNVALLGLFFIVILSFIFLFLSVKDKAVELSYYVNRSLKSKLTVNAIVKNAVKNGRIRNFYTKKNLSRIICLGFVTIVISAGMTLFVTPPKEPMAFESYTPEFTIKKFMTIDGRNFSYGMQGFMEVNDYVKVNFTVFSNDTIEFYLKSTNGYSSNKTYVVGPNNNTKKEYIHLNPGRYQLIYYVIEDEDNDEKAIIHIDVTINPKKVFQFGPEFLPLIFAMFLFSTIRPSYLIAKMK